MTYIKAPYNFVPLSKKVVYPKWNSVVSHDVPFEDAESGTISVKIKAHSPIFVKDSSEKNSFFKNGLNHYIPGSSIKGALRSVLEILSFSRLSKNNTNDDRYSVRDFQNTDIYPKLDLAKEVWAAWLWHDGDTFYMQDCNKPGRIPHHWIDEHFGTDFRSFYKTGGGFSGNNKLHKPAKFKYERFRNHNQKVGFVRAEYGTDNQVDSRKFYKIDTASDIKGTLVFTGQPGPRNEPTEKGKKPSGKIHEFIFFESNNEPFEVSENVIKNFFFAYFDHDRNRQSIDWKYWKPKLDNGEKIPVFFRYEDEKSNKIKDIGLSYLYKIVYKKSVLESVPKAHRSDDKDFAETLFGYIDNKQSLKGRVHIGHAILTNNANELEEKKEVLAGPKASYYPNYIEQNGKNGITKSYNTFMNDSAILSGRKRYPVHQGSEVNSNPGSEVNSNPGSDNVSTRFKPLGSGAEFEFKIRVHNLRKAEIGALLSALTFHNTQDTFHSIGMAKPLGYGKVSFDVTSIEGFSTDDITVFLKEFEAYMNYGLQNKFPEWHSSPQIIELLAMVTEQNNTGASELKYMEMSVQGQNEFVKAKKENEFLEKYSNLVNSKKAFTSLIDQTYLAEFSEKEKAFERRIEDAEITKAYSAKITQEKELIIDQLTKLLAEIRDDIDRQISKTESEISSINKVIKKSKLGGQPKLDNIDPKNKKAFDNLKKEIEKFAAAYHGVNNLKKLVKEHPDGILPEEHHQIVIEKVNTIFNNLSPKDKKKRIVVFKNKLMEWLGQETARQWFNELIK